MIRVFSLQVAKIIPNPTHAAATKELNAAIPAWVKKNSSTASPMYTADCSQEAGYEPAYNRDGVHPNDEGDKFIAGVVGPLLAKIL